MCNQFANEIFDVTNIHHICRIFTEIKFFIFISEIIAVELLDRTIKQSNKQMIELSANDFSLKQGKKGLLLCNNVTSLSMVLFYRDDCKDCTTFLNTCRTLSAQISYCTFAIINLSKSSNIAVEKLSGHTQHSIGKVPWLVVHLNTIPKMIYQGSLELQEMKGFLEAVKYRFSIEDFEFAKCGACCKSFKITEICKQHDKDIHNMCNGCIRSIEQNPQDLFECVVCANFKHRSTIHIFTGSGLKHSDTICELCYRQCIVAYKSCPICRVDHEKESIL